MCGGYGILASIGPAFAIMLMQLEPLSGTNIQMKEEFLLEWKTELYQWVIKTIWYHEVLPFDAKCVYIF